MSPPRPPAAGAGRDRQLAACLARFIATSVRQCIESQPEARTLLGRAPHPRPHPLPAPAVLPQRLPGGPLPLRRGRGLRRGHRFGGDGRPQGGEAAVEALLCPLSKSCPPFHLPHAHSDSMGSLLPRIAQVYRISPGWGATGAGAGQMGGGGCRAALTTLSAHAVPLRRP
jgi:hypothetical protein